MKTKNLEVLVIPLFICVVIFALIIGVFVSASEPLPAPVDPDPITGKSDLFYYDDLGTGASLDLIINNTNSVFLTETAPANLEVKYSLTNLSSANCRLIFKDKDDSVRDLPLMEMQTVSNLEVGTYAVNLSCIDSNFQTLYDYITIEVI